MDLKRTLFMANIITISLVFGFIRVPIILPLLLILKDKLTIRELWVIVISNIIITTMLFGLDIMSMPYIVLKLLIPIIAVKNVYVYFGIFAMVLTFYLMMILNIPNYIAISLGANLSILTLASTIEMFRILKERSVVFVKE